MEWKYFSEKELKCKGTGECHMDSAFMKKLVTLREEFNKPIILTSAYRSPTYNIRIGGAENSPHVFGRAVDIQCLGSEAYEIIRLGIKQLGDDPFEFFMNKKLNEKMDLLLDTNAETLKEIKTQLREVNHEKEMLKEKTSQLEQELKKTDEWIEASNKFTDEEIDKLKG